MTSAQDELSAQYKHTIQVMRPVIDALLAQFEGFGVPDTGEVASTDLPHAQIEEFLANLDIYFPGAGHRKLKLAIRCRLMRLGCWKYRLIAKSRSDGSTAAVWNPLETPLQQFKTINAQHDLIYRETDQSYPPEDIIADWIQQQLPENLYSE